MEKMAVKCNLLQVRDIGPVGMTVRDVGVTIKNLRNTQVQGSVKFPDYPEENTFITSVFSITCGGRPCFLVTLLHVWKFPSD